MTVCERYCVAERIDGKKANDLIDPSSGMPLVLGVAGLQRAVEGTYLHESLPSDATDVSAIDKDEYREGGRLVTVYSITDNKKGDKVVVVESDIKDGTPKKKGSKTTTLIDFTHNLVTQVAPIGMFGFEIPQAGPQILIDSIVGKGKLYKHISYGEPKIIERPKAAAGAAKAA